MIKNFRADVAVGAFRLLCCGVLVIAVHCQVHGQDSVKLFDGKSFQGWEGDTAKTFRIEQEAIVAGSLEKKVPATNSFAPTRNTKTSN